MTNDSNKKLNIFVYYIFNSFHSEKLRKLIDDENISVERFRYLCSAISAAEEANEPYWLPKRMI